ncbi:MAG: hypothetical protein ACKO9B_14090 [Planctomycetota bacterium]
MARGSLSIDGARESRSDRRGDGSWPWPTRVAFRFVFVWFLVEFHSALVQLVPLLEPLAVGIDRAKRPLYVWIARTVCGIRIESFSESSCDTTYDWVRVAANVVIAAAGCALWTLLDRGSRGHPRLADALRTAIRFTLALSMFTYGFAKVFPLQFQPLEVPALLRTYGESSPMGLLWNFMAASRTYTVFAGGMEIVGGLLLCFRRTQLAGALWTAGVMANVFMLNLCYDVPVKLFSFQLLLLALVVAAPNVPRLVAMFLRNEAVPPADLLGPWRGSRWSRAATGLKIAWLGATLGLLAFGSSQTAAFLAPSAAPGTRAGTWEIGEFSRDGHGLPPLEGDARRFRFVTIVDRSEGKAFMIEAMDRSRRTWLFEDRDGGIDLFDPAPGDGGGPRQGAPAGALSLALDGENGLRGTGKIGGERIEFTGRRLDRGDFLLVNRGFHLVNEAPFNR